MATVTKPETTRAGIILAAHESGELTHLSAALDLLELERWAFAETESALTIEYRKHWFSEGQAAKQALIVLGGAA